MKTEAERRAAAQARKPAPKAQECGNRLSVRIPDAPVDQWESATCIQEYDHARKWDTPCSDGSGTAWRIVDDFAWRDS